VVECGGFENRCLVFSGPGVRISLPPHTIKFSPRSLMDKTEDSGSSAVGSIPAEGTKKLRRHHGGVA
jgi:hypothetical protein